MQQQMECRQLFCKALIGSPGSDQRNQGPTHYDPVYVYKK